MACVADSSRMWLWWETQWAWWYAHYSHNVRGSSLQRYAYYPKFKFPINQFILTSLFYKFVVSKTSVDTKIYSQVLIYNTLVGVLGLSYSSTRYPFTCYTMWILIHLAIDTFFLLRSRRSSKGQALQNEWHFAKQITILIMRYTKTQNDNVIPRG